MISIDYIDEKLLDILLRKGWSYLREDFLREFLKRFGVELEQWEWATRCFYLAGIIKTSDGEFRIWKPVTNPIELMVYDEKI